ncbi:MAG: hypothetical protein IJR13_09785 [Bacteroidales bacterium]|nr:hypothetical protein [Bacteroidales bacterium]
MRPTKTLLAIVLLFFFMQGCKKFEGDTTVPCYLRIDSIAVEKQSANAPSPEAGWYTHDIDAVQLIAHYEGSGKETNIGTFQLPCLTPVLYEGTVDYVRIVPVIKQNGIAQTRIEYPYLKDTVVRNLTMRSLDTICLGTLDSDNDRYYMTVNYKGTDVISELVFEPFEPLATTIVFDTTIDGVEWIDNDTENARTGSGYLLITTPDSSTGITFPLTSECTVADPSKLLYLEMDYRTDVYLRVGIYSRSLNGGSYSTQWAIMLYPRNDWGKIYINLGRLWAQFNHYKDFRIVFSTLNPDGTGGQSFIDNLKVITY